MNTLQNKIDFVALIAVHLANANGDPLNGNRPRTDYDGFGEISDVCIKRKIRNRMQDEGKYIFVQSVDRRDNKFDNAKSLKERAETIPALKEAGCFEYAGVAIASKEEFVGATDEILAKERAKAQTFVDSYGGKIYDGYKTLIESDYVDAIYLPLPPGLHYKWAKAALDAGKHTLVEKPCTIALANTEDLLNEAGDKGLAVHENYMFAFHDQIEAAAATGGAGAGPIAQKNMDIVVEEANTVIVALLPVCVPEIKQTAQELTISFRHQGESLLPPRLSDWIETGDKLQIPETEGFQIAIGEFRTARYARGDDAECVMIHTVLFQELMCLQHTVPAPFPGGIHPVQVVGFFKTVHR